MATLILSGVGRLVAGPLGGAVGAVLGNALDHRLLGPKARQGARLSDLAVQASEYGAVLPKLYGRTRVAGTVIWATDLRETRTRVSQGKGRPKVDTYSYTASFAVALSARAILRVERIWADGSLLKGAAGDWKRDAVMRVHVGDPGQALDPLIASAEGLACCPAYRGLAYAVFENLPLGDFGNRIPQLSFEVVADETAVSAGVLLGSEGGPEFAGYAVTDGRLGDLARGLGRIAPFVIDGGARFAPGDTHAFDEVASVAGQGATVTRTAESALPARLAIDYADGARDYQAGRQAAGRLAGGLGEDLVSLPAVLEAGSAKALADNVLARLWRERTRCEVSLDWRALDVRPGDLVTLPDDPTVWRVAASMIEGMYVRLSLVVHGAASWPVRATEPGRVTGEVDQPAGETRLVVLDLPPLGGPSETPLVTVLANGSSAGWRRAALQASRDGGASWEPLGATALPATIGVATSVLGTGPAAATIDRINHVDVTLAHAGLMLADADEAALAGGANLAMLGGEAIQFGRAMPVGGATWRLSELWRGRCGTCDAIATHVVAEDFALIETASIRFLASEDAIVGAVVSAQGVGDTAPVTTVIASADRALRPLAPVWLKVAHGDDGITLSWIRCSRDGFVWRDGVDVPLAEEREAYRLEVSGGGAAVSVEVVEPRWTVPLDFASPGASVSVTVRQIGRHGLSEAAAINFVN